MEATGSSIPDNVNVFGGFSPAHSLESVLEAAKNVFEGKCYIALGGSGMSPSLILSGKSAFFHTLDMEEDGHLMDGNVGGSMDKVIDAGAKALKCFFGSGHEHEFHVQDPNGEYVAEFP